MAQIKQNRKRNVTEFVISFFLCPSYSPQFVAALGGGKQEQNQVLQGNGIMKLVFSFPYFLKNYSNREFFFFSTLRFDNKTPYASRPFRMRRIVIECSYQRNWNYLQKKNSLVFVMASSALLSTSLLMSA